MHPRNENLVCELQRVDESLVLGQAYRSEPLMRGEMDVLVVDDHERAEGVLAHRGPLRRK